MYIQPGKNLLCFKTNISFYPREDNKHFVHIAVADPGIYKQEGRARCAGAGSAFTQPVNRNELFHSQQDLALLQHQDFQWVLGDPVYLGDHPVQVFQILQVNPKHKYNSTLKNILFTVDG